LARQLGSNEGINVSVEDVAERVRALTHGTGAEVVFEAVGVGTTEVVMHNCFRCDDQGVGLASGAYFARLRVRGNGIDETMTRKVLLIR